MSGSAPRQRGAEPGDDQIGQDAAHYEELQESWPTERPSRKRGRPLAKRQGRRKRGHIHVTAKRLDEPDVVRLSRALLAAQRELARAQAEANARAQARSITTKGDDTDEGQEPS